MSKRTVRDDIYQFHDCGVYLPARTLYMGSESVEEDGESGVDAAMAERVIKNLYVLDVLSKDPITILMNNPGGDVNHGLAIYDAIRACKSPVTVQVLGHAMSMGSIILQAADRRIMAPNASQMIHYGQLSVDKHAKTVYKITAEFKRIDEWMERLYLEKMQEKDPKATLKKLRALLDHDTYLTAAQSVELGLCDEVLGDGE